MKKLLLGIAVLAFVAEASAQDQRPEYGPPINTATAKQIAAGVIAE